MFGLVVCMIGLANWLGHNSNINEINYTSCEYTANSYEVTDPWLPNFVPILPLFPLANGSQNHPCTHPKCFHFPPKTTPTFCPNHPCTKTNFPPNEEIDPLRTFACGILVSEPPLYTFRCLLKSDPTYAQNQPPIFLNPPTLLFTRFHLHFASETFRWFEVRFKYGLNIGVTFEWFVGYITGLSLTSLFLVHVLHLLDKHVDP